MGTDVVRCGSAGSGAQVLRQLRGIPGLDQWCCPCALVEALVHIHLRVHPVRLAQTMALKLKAAMHHCMRCTRRRA